MNQDDAQKAIREIERAIADVLVDRPKKDNAQSVLNAIRTIDLYMTGKSTARNLIDDSRKAAELAEGGAEWMVYLSDGGYTRIVIAPWSEPNRMWITGSNGHYDWDAVKAKWDAIYTSY
ncbi:MAG: hypothetical protein CMF52_03020 [Legionellales bacterium]|nr:hypothetical protein [Legionellales bacterium]